MDICYLSTVATSVTAVNTYLKNKFNVSIQKLLSFYLQVLRNRCQTENKKISIYLFCRIKARRFLFYCSFQRDSIACRCFNDIKSAWLWTNVLPTFLFNSHFLQISGTAEICHHPGHSCKLKKVKNIKTFKKHYQIKIHSDTVADSEQHFFCATLQIFRNCKSEY